MVSGLTGAHGLRADGRTRRRPRNHVPGPSRGATLTGLEPATSAVTGRHSNQLSYRALRVDPLSAPTYITLPDVRGAHGPFRCEPSRTLGHHLCAARARRRGVPPTGFEPVSPA